VGLSVVLLQKTFKRGTPILAIVTVTNYKDQAVRILDESPPGSCLPHLRYQDDMDVPLTAEGERRMHPLLVSASNRTHDPGQRASCEIRLGDIFDLARAGRYKLTVSRLVFTDDGHPPITVESPLVEFYVTE
jgi:hypothetical protein